MRTIDADQFAALLQDLADKHAEGGKTDVAEILISVKAMVERQQTIEAVPGHWTEKQNTMYDSTWGEDVHWFTYVCSKCGKEAMNDFPFCPFCGTKMDLE